jgi:methionyl aminopeptidase
VLARREEHRLRYKVERSFAWLGNFRRLLIRWERTFAVYRSFFEVALVRFCLRRLFPGRTLMLCRLDVCRWRNTLVATTDTERAGLRRANHATAQLLHHLATLARPGVTTSDLNDYAMDYISQLGAIPVFATEEGFPGCINTSVNDVAVHGVPGKQQLKLGDVLSIDAGMLLDGYAGDATITIAIGKIAPKHQLLIETTREAMMAGIQAAQPGQRIGDIGYAIQSVAWSRGFDVVREYIGHGLGHAMHEPPAVPSVGRPGTGPVIPEGLVMTIEPILVEKVARMQVDPDGWSVRTRDGGWAAQFEHTIIVTPHGADILSVL